MYYWFLLLCSFFSSAHDFFPCNVCATFLREDLGRHIFGTHGDMHKQCFFCDERYSADPLIDHRNVTYKNDIKKQNRQHVKSKHTALMAGLAQYFFTRNINLRAIGKWNKSYSEQVKNPQSTESALFYGNVECSECQNKNVPVLAALFHGARDHWFTQGSCKHCSETFIFFGTKKHEKFDFLFSIKHMLSNHKNELYSLMHQTFPAIKGSFSQVYDLLQLGQAQTFVANQLQIEQSIHCITCKQAVPLQSFYPHMAMHSMILGSNSVSCGFCPTEFSLDDMDAYMLHAIECLYKISVPVEGRDGECNATNCNN